MERRDKFTKKIVNSPPTQPRGKIENVFQTMREAWEVSESCRRLKSTLESREIPSEINKIVGLACAPMAFCDDERRPRRSAFQHALVLTLRDVLGKERENPDSIICYAQDPNYIEIDRLVLEGSGIHILDDLTHF